MNIPNVDKNELEADISYLGDDHWLFSYMFLNLLSLYLNFQILNMITEEHSVKDILLILSKIKMYSMERDEIMSEKPKQAAELVSDLKIDPDILRKNQGLNGYYWEYCAFLLKNQNYKTSPLTETFFRNGVSTMGENGRTHDSISAKHNFNPYILQARMQS